LREKLEIKALSVDQMKLVIRLKELGDAAMTKKH